MLNARDIILIVFHVMRERVRVRAAKGQLASLDVLHTHALPIEKIAESLGAVPLVDTLTTRLAAEVVHVRGQLIDGVINTLGSAIDDVDSVVGRVLDKLFHVAAET